MNFLRQIMVLALMSMTAWGGTPHVACRCSDGKILLHCPRLKQALVAKTTAVVGSTSTRDGKSCCCGGGEKSCCRSNPDPERRPDSCCAEGCRCTPVYLQANSVPCLKNVSVPELMQIDFASVVMLVNRDSRTSRIDVICIDTSQRIPDDLILLCERWLV